MNKFLQLLKTTFEIILVISFIFLEELIWKKLALPIKNWLSGLKILEKIQTKIEALDEYSTLGVFVVPLIIAEYMGAKSGVMMLTGSFTWGLILYGLKIPVAGLTFWIFSFTKEKLLTILWFKILYDMLMTLFDWVKSTTIYRKTRVGMRNFKKKFSGSGYFKNEISNIYSSMKGLFGESNVKS